MCLLDKQAERLSIGDFEISNLLFPQPELLLTFRWLFVLPQFYRDQSSGHTCIIKKETPGLITPLLCIAWLGGGTCTDKNKCGRY